MFHFQMNLWFWSLHRAGGWGLCECAGYLESSVYDGLKDS